MPRQVINNFDEVISTQFINCLPLFSGRKKIAVAIGSRGISNILPILEILLEECKKYNLSPFVLAAMGSHGGGTETGQLDILHGFGITEKVLGVPVYACMDLVNVQGNRYKESIMINKLAWEADGIIPVNRIKKHTDIHADIESGLLKMIAIGLGNQEQSEKLHYGGLKYLTESIPQIGFDIIATGKIIFGLAIVENAFAETAMVEIIPANEIISREKELLCIAKQLSATLPVENIDVLIIDRGGKNISGSCIETNIIGRMNLLGEVELDTPNIKRIIVTDLTEQSCGNAAGIGLADFITRHFFDKIDFEITYNNSISCFYPERGKIPVVMENDRAALLAAMKTCRNFDWKNPRIIRIRDTLHLEEMYVTKNIYNEVANNKLIECKIENIDIFNRSESLIPF